MIRKIQNWWWARQRKTDLWILWPAIKSNTPSLAAAHRVMMIHCMNDPAWARPYGSRLWHVIKGLT